MSVMERRLQLLLDQQRYDRVSAEATKSGRSVAAVIRQAIDVTFPAGGTEREAAMEEFLRLTEVPLPGAVQPWAEAKAEMEADEVARMDRVLGQ